MKPEIETTFDVGWDPGQPLDEQTRGWSGVPSLESLLESNMVYGNS